MVFPSSSSLNGHPGRPGKRAAGGRGRPGARGPGRGPAVVWAQPGCLGAFSCRAPDRSQQEIGWLLSSCRPTDHERACYCAPPRAVYTGADRRRAALPAPPGPPSDRPPRPPRWSERAGLLIKASSRTFPPIDPLLLRTDMSNPDDDTDVPSGFNEDAEMERTSPRTSEITSPWVPYT